MVEVWQRLLLSGAESDVFVSSSTALASLMGLANGPSGTIKIDGQEIDIDLAEDSLSDIQTKINETFSEAVSASIISSTDDEGECITATAHRGHDGFSG